MANGPALAHIKNLRLTLGGAPLFDGVDFVLHKGERAALVGANGAGKSTLMRMLAGATGADGGEIAFSSGATVAFATQDPDLSGFATLRDYVQSSSTQLDGRSSEVPAYRAEAALADFGLEPERAPVNLSGGERRRASLARALAADADILLLDEPTNHLDIAAIELLEQEIMNFRGACLIVSHDRRFLERVSTATLWLRQRRAIKSDRGFANFDEWAEAVELEEERALARLETHLKAEEHWLRRGVTARRSRNEGRRRKLEALRGERRERKELSQSARAVLVAEKGTDSGRLVMEAASVSKSYGGRAVIANFSLRVMRGDRVGIVGANGAGKTTLLEILLKRRDPDTGNVKLGEGLQIAYVDQSRAFIDDNASIWETLAPQGGDQVIVRGQPRHVAGYAREFLFGPEQLRQPVSALSGGERNRLALAVALAKPANLLVLDEPTNDLDMDTLDVLEDMLAAYDGTVLLVSHDRAFLDGVATQIVGPLGNGRWIETPGGWADFERAFPNAIAPKQAKEAQPRTSAPPPSPKRQTKLSYKDERRIQELETLMPKLRAEIEALEASLSDASAFVRDAGAFDRAAARLAQARHDIEASEAEWLEIELRREGLSIQE
ncbi:MAG: ABC-F family ATP-binding cassette domain-containing protein [Terricaulis sp.]